MYTGKCLSLERSGIIGKSRDYNDKFPYVNTQRRHRSAWAPTHSDQSILSVMNKIILPWIDDSPGAISPKGHIHVSDYAAEPILNGSSFNVCNDVV